MSIFKERSALKSRLRKYITCWGFLRAFCRKLSIYSKYNQYFQICGFMVYMDNFRQNARRKPRHVIYFRNLLFSVRLLSYRTLLRSDNFEKFTYNANMFFQNSLRGTYKYFFICQKCISKNSPTSQIV